jgi:hypothetical protein
MAESDDMKAHLTSQHLIEGIASSCNLLNPIVGQKNDKGA